MGIRILNWNVCSENPLPPEDIVNFLLSFNPDIVCLQEVSEGVLSAIKKKTDGIYTCVVANDFRSAQGGVYFLVVLSRFPVLKHRAIRARHQSGWRSFFSSLWHPMEEHLESLRVDVKFKNRRLKILNVHLEVGTGPKNRIDQFRHALRHGMRRFTIRNALVVGDLNIYGQGWYERFVGWLWFGLRFVELLMDERKEFERLFEKRGLKNVFRGETTFSVGGVDFQFDHTLVSRDIPVVSHSVIADLRGSDHRPTITGLGI